MVAAYGKNRELGAKNDLLWHFREMRRDMANFRSKTLNTTVIMGRKTLDSMGGKPLPERENIVLTRENDLKVDGIVVARSVEEALELAKPDVNVVNIIGGAAIYEQFMPLAENIYATEVDAAFPNADVFFPTLDDSWKKVSWTDFESDEDNKYGFSFVKYSRKTS